MKGMTNEFVIIARSSLLAFANRGNGVLASSSPVRSPPNATAIHSRAVILCSAGQLDRAAATAVEDLVISWAAGGVADEILTARRRGD